MHPFYDIEEGLQNGQIDPKEAIVMLTKRLGKHASFEADPPTFQCPQDPRRAQACAEHHAKLEAKGKAKK